MQTFIISLFAMAGSLSVLNAQSPLPYTTYSTMEEMMAANDARYVPLVRVSDPGTSAKPAYTGFFFYQCLQFDESGRYLLGMKIHVQNRVVEPTDVGEIGFFDRKQAFQWTRIGQTTAWNWQQGARLQWRPLSDEIVWNDRSDDGRHFIARVYDFRTGKRRTLPRPIYALSPDGRTALTHDFERMKHGGTDYVGIEDKFKNEFAPSGTGIWKMDMDSGQSKMILSIKKIAALVYPGGAPSSGCLYVFREGYNPSGTRIIVFVKESESRMTKGFSMTPEGTSIRYLYNSPSHHSWQDDDSIMDWGEHVPPGGGPPVKGYFLFRDDGSGAAKELLWVTPHNGHNSYVPRPGGDWILSDTYSIDGVQHLFLYHRPAKRFVPLAKLKSTAQMGIHRVDLHPRLSPDGKTISIDSTYEGLGRQMYIADIGHIVNNPPGRRTSSR
jgi:hypothetical protein